MANLPDALPLDPVAGQPASDRSVAPTDFGLSEVAQGLDRNTFLRTRVIAEEKAQQAKADLQAVTPLLANLQGETEADVKTGIAAGPSVTAQPGFVGGVIDRTMQRVDRVAGTAGLTPGQSQALRTAGIAHANAIANAAASAHADALAKPIAEAAQAQQTQALGAGQIAFDGVFQPGYQALQLGHAAGDTDLPAKTGALFDQAQTAALAATPDDLKPQLQAELAAQRVKYVSAAQDFQLQTAQTQQLQNLKTQVSTAANTLVTAPASYDDFMSTTAPKIIAGAPPALQQAITEELHESAAKATVQGLIDQGHPQIAQQQLAAGKYDAYLPTAVKADLVHTAAVAVMKNEPMTGAQAAQQTQDRATADTGVQQMLATGNTSMDPSKLALSPEETAKYAQMLSDAKSIASAKGSAASMSSAALAATINSVPPKDVDQYRLYQLQTAAAQKELTARLTTPGSWAMASNGQGNPNAAAGANMGTNHGLALSQMWETVQNSQGPALARAASAFAGSMLTTQANFGVPKNAMQVLDPSRVQALASNLISAGAEGRAQALSNMAALLEAMPAQTRLPDGSWVSPRLILQRQLLGAGVDQKDMAAMVDNGSGSSALAYHAEVSQDALSMKPLPGKQEADMQAKVMSALRPVLATSAGVVGASAMNAGRVDQVMMDVRHQIANGTNVDSAVNAAVGRLKGDNIYTDAGYYVPQAVAANASAVVEGRGGGSVVRTGAGAIAQGLNHIVASLTANGGQNLGLTDARTPPAARAMLIASSGQWKNNPDGSGLVLTVPSPDGTLSPVKDRWGRPVSATWDQIKQQTGPTPANLFAAPPHIPIGPGGAPLPAVTRQVASDALNQGIEDVESGGRARPGALLSNGERALGVMQVRPSSAAAYAMRLTGAPLDVDRLENDDAYNRRFGRAISADLTNHYGSSPGGVLLSATGYFEGQGNTDKLIVQNGDPRQTGDLAGWVKKLPPRGQAYVEKVMHQAFLHLEAAGR